MHVPTIASDLGLDKIAALEGHMQLLATVNPSATLLEPQPHCALSYDLSASANAPPLQEREAYLSDFSVEIDTLAELVCGCLQIIVHTRGGG